MAKGRIVGKLPLAVRAFQPQDPGPIDANTVLDKNAKRSPAALMDAEILFGGAMGAGLAAGYSLNVK